MAAVVEDLLYWVVISGANLGYVLPVLTAQTNTPTFNVGGAGILISVAIYGSTKFERHRRTQSQYSLSTRHVKILSFPSSFIYLSLLTGILNCCAAYLRFRRIYLLSIPTLPWFPSSTNASLDDALTPEFIEAQWIVAANDWSSLLLALLFCLAAAFNFATVRQLRLRDEWIKRSLLPVYTPTAPGSDEPWSPTAKSPDGSGRARSTSIAFLSELQTTCAKRG